MHETISPLPQYAFMAWCSDKKKLRNIFTFTLSLTAFFHRDFHCDDNLYIMEKSLYSQSCNYV